MSNDGSLMAALDQVEADPTFKAKQAAEWRKITYPFDEGVKAGCARQDQSANPYGPDCLEGKAWLRGHTWGLEYMDTMEGILDSERGNA